MSDYTVATDFSVKDSLPSGDDQKIILGSDIDDEFDAIATAIATKAEGTGPAMEVTAAATFTADWGDLWDTPPTETGMRYIVYSDGTHKIWCIMSDDGASRLGNINIFGGRMVNLPEPIQAFSAAGATQTIRSRIQVSAHPFSLGSGGTQMLGNWAYLNNANDQMIASVKGVPDFTVSTFGIGAGEVLWFQDLINDR